MIALSRPVNILSWAITRIAVTGRTSGVDFEIVKKFSTKLGIIVALLVGLIPLLSSPLIGSFLNVKNHYLFFPLCATLFIWSLNGILRGLYTSIESFGILSYTAILELFTRAFFGISLVLLGFKVFGALSGSVFGALSLFILLLSHKKSIGKVYNERKTQGISEEGFRSITTKVFFIAIPTGFFLELDLLLAKRFFGSEEAGIYAASALIGKGLLMFSTVAATVVYPKLVEERLSKKGIVAFFWGIGITLVLFGSGYIFLRLFGNSFVALLFGEKYLGVAELVPLYVIALIPLALHLQITNYKGAIGGWIEGGWLWLVLSGYYLYLEIFSSSIISYFKAIFIFHLIATPLSSIILYLRHRGKVSANLNIKPS